MCCLHQAFVRAETASYWEMRKNHVIPPPFVIYILKLQSLHISWCGCRFRFQPFEAAIAWIPVVTFAILNAWCAGHTRPVTSLHAARCCILKYLRKCWKIINRGLLQQSVRRNQDLWYAKIIQRVYGSCYENKLEHGMRIEKLEYFVRIETLEHVMPKGRICGNRDSGKEGLEIPKSPFFITWNGVSTSWNCVST